MPNKQTYLNSRNYERIKLIPNFSGLINDLLDDYFEKINIKNNNSLNNEKKEVDDMKKLIDEKKKRIESIEKEHNITLEKLKKERDIKINNVRDFISDVYDVEASDDDINEYLDMIDNGSIKSIKDFAVLRQWISEPSPYNEE